MERKGLDIGQRISVYFDDGVRVTRKDGILTSKDDDFITLDYKESINRDRIIRIEALR